MLSVALHFITGLALGVDIAPSEGVYCIIYLGIIELAFLNGDVINLEDE